MIHVYRLANTDVRGGSIFGIVICRPWPSPTIPRLAELKHSLAASCCLLIGRNFFEAFDGDRFMWLGWDDSVQIGRGWAVVYPTAAAGG